MASRGSVIPLFIEQIKAGKSLTITDPEMTRFMMTLDHAVELFYMLLKTESKEICLFKNHLQRLFLY